ncbi:MAG: CRISPR-associated protein Cas4 [Candidatus Hydrothermae bacterium]|nr:CRISPR-associated protein Cas4 [Candidatus Hydrothermae bacterium]
MGRSIQITATVFYSYHICHREAWFYYHGVSSNKDHPLLSLGRYVHEDSYSREKKEIFVDRSLKIDILRDQLVAELKKSSRHQEAARMQLAYYLYYLKHKKGVECKGVLLFPKERKTEEVVLTAELENKIEDLLEEIKEVITRDKPPPRVKIRYCKTCAFYEFCFGDEI